MARHTSGVARKQGITFQGTRFERLDFVPAQRPGPLRLSWELTHASTASISLSLFLQCASANATLVLLGSWRGTVRIRQWNIWPHQGLKNGDWKCRVPHLDRVLGIVPTAQSQSPTPPHDHLHLFHNVCLGLFLWCRVDVDFLLIKWIAISSRARWICHSALAFSLILAEQEFLHLVLRPSSLCPRRCH